MAASAHFIYRTEIIAAGLWSFSFSEQDSPAGVRGRVGAFSLQGVEAKSWRGGQILEDWIQGKSVEYQRIYVLLPLCFFEKFCLRRWCGTRCTYVCVCSRMHSLWGDRYCIWCNRGLA